MLGVSDKRVYAYVEEGRLPAVRAAHVIMIPVAAVRKFKPSISGRPRKHTPAWRVSPEDNLLLTTSLVVQVKAGQQARLQEKLEEVKQAEEYTFPGSVARYIIWSKFSPEKLEILLVWRSSTMPDEDRRKQTIETLQQALGEVVDWNTAQYDEGQVLMHT